MPGEHLTVEEIVATIRHSNLPTIVVEGRDDMTVVRWLERQIGVQAALLACGGRVDLFEVFRRRNEFQGKRVAFLADRDLMIFTGIPAEHADIVFTKGYSIENDMLMSARLERLLETQEKEGFSRDLDQLALWFGFVVEALSRGACIPCALHPNHLVPLNTFKLSPGVCAQHGYQPPSGKLYWTLRRSYKRLIRGKTIIQLLLRYLCRPTRESKFSSRNLLELGVKSDRHPRELTELARNLGARLASP